MPSKILGTPQPVSASGSAEGVFGPVRSVTLITSLRVNDRSCYRTRKFNYERRTVPDRFANLQNPAELQLNVALEKTIHFSERYRFQFRGEAFNVTTPIRPGPDTNFDHVSTFGQLPKTQNNWPRILQVAGKIYF